MCCLLRTRPRNFTKFLCSRVLQIKKFRNLHEMGRVSSYAMTEASARNFCAAAVESLSIFTATRSPL